MVQEMEHDDFEEFDEEEFVPEAILDKRHRNGKVEYYIKWRGWEECTWEVAESLPSNCNDVISLYESTRDQNSS